jgi:hypothetical protein
MGRTVVLLCVLQLAGCSLLLDRRDAAWDPRGGQQLIDQIPAWDDAAAKTCGGHLRDHERGHRSPRC